MKHFRRKPAENSGYVGWKSKHLEDGHSIIQIKDVCLTSFHVKHNSEKLRITNYFYILQS